MRCTAATVLVRYVECIYMRGVSLHIGIDISHSIRILYWLHTRYIHTYIQIHKHT